MATLSSGTTINSTGFLQLPSGNATTGAQGQLRFNARSNNIEWYNPSMGGQWTFMTLPWAARDIQTTGYLHGGYAASAVWNNTNRITFATDTTVDLTGTGQVQEAAHNYQSCGWNNRRSFTWGASGAHCVAASNVICFDMVTEQSVTSGYTRNWPYAHINNGTINNETYYCYVTSGYGGSAIYEWNLSTETLGSQFGTAGGIWGAWTEHYGIFYGGGERVYNFATRQPYLRGGVGSTTALAGDGYQHNMQTRKQYTIAGREGNPSTNWRLTNYTNNSSYDAIGGKPAYSGEENMMSAREWGYCLGFYNGVHVNTTYKVNYVTWAGFTTSSTTQPKGRVGNSSGTMSWRP